jgi:hypothetical protein
MSQDSFEARRALRAAQRYATVLTAVQDTIMNIINFIPAPSAEGNLVMKEKKLKVMQARSMCRKALCSGREKKLSMKMDCSQMMHRQHLLNALVLSSHTKC